MTDPKDRSTAIHTDPGTDNPVRVKYFSLFDLQHMAHPDNPKDHDIGAIITSIVRFGYVTPVILDSERTRIVAGHGRVEALAAMKRDGNYEVPERIRLANNDWLVPCVVGIQFSDDLEALGFLIADNRISELGGWNDADLTAALEKVYESQHGLDGTGYDEEDLNRIVDYLDNPIIQEPESDLVSIDLLKPHPLNYRTHPDDQIEQLTQSIEQHGFFRKVVAANDYTILAGHGLVQAALALNLPRVPVVKLPIEPDSPAALRILVGDNETTRLGEVDDRALTGLLKKIKDSDQYGLEGTGFDNMMLANLAMVTRPASEVRDIDTAAEWVGMPEYDADGTDGPKMIVRFRSEDDRRAFIDHAGLEGVISAQGKDKTMSVWWPKKEVFEASTLRFAANEPE